MHSSTEHPALERESQKMAASARHHFWIEVSVVLIAVALIAWSATNAMRNHTEQLEKAEEIQETKTALLYGARAMEKNASSQDGFYTSIELDDSATSIEGYELPSNIDLAVLETEGETYCLQATNTSIVADPWRTATYESSDQSFSPDDECK